MLGQAGAPVAEPAAREPQPGTLRAEAEKDVGDGQAAQLGVGDARRSARALAHAEQEEGIVGAVSAASIEARRSGQRDQLEILARTRANQVERRRSIGRCQRCPRSSRSRIW